MTRFRFTHAAIDTVRGRGELTDGAAGGYVSFEGWVRDHNEGREVSRLEYEAYSELAVEEGDRIVGEALGRFPIKHALCIHRLGELAIGEMAVWVGASSAHRAEAFEACRYIIDEVKHRLPIWKKEFYLSGDSGWVGCERCAAAPLHVQGDDHGHDHGHEDRGQERDEDRDRTVVRNRSA
jgi:molybdopterin synthase catalytic subunit